MKSKKKKRLISIIAIALVAAMLITGVVASLVGCGKTDEPSQPVKEQTADSAVSQEQDANTSENATGTTDVLADLTSQVESLLGDDKPAEAAQLIVDAYSTVDDATKDKLVAMYDDIYEHVYLHTFESENKYEDGTSYHMVYKYDDMGRLIYSADDTTVTESEFDDEGRLLQTTTSDVIGNISDIYIYNYDQDGVLSSETELDGDNNIISSTQYDYDEQGRQVSLRREDSTEIYSAYYKYLDDTDIAIEVTTESEGEFWYQSIDTYDESGALIKSFYSDQYGVWDTDFEVEYDDYGNMTKSISRQGNDVVEDISYEREYDAKGREISTLYKHYSEYGFDSTLTVMEYDDKDRLLHYTATSIDEDGSSSFEEERISTYDELGRETKYELYYNEDHSDYYIVDTSYNDDGSYTCYIKSSGENDIERRFDARGNLRYEKNGDDVTEYELDIFGTVVKETLNGNVKYSATITYHYNPLVIN